MKKQTIIIIMLALVAVAGWGQTKVWNEVVSGYANSPLVNVTKVALYDDRTEVSIHIDFVKGQWIRIAPNTVLDAAGKSYAVKESTVLKLGEQYTLTEDTLNFMLTFEPLPATTKKFDMMEPNGWLVTNIHSANE